MRVTFTVIVLTLILAFNCQGETMIKGGEGKFVHVDEKKYERAVFAGGCFWCMESAFQELDGVIEVISGYAGGEEKNPSYKQVSSGVTGHREAVIVIYDFNKINYKALLDVFWRNINPMDNGGQFNDRGFQYTAAIFYFDEEQKKLAEESKKALASSGKFDKPIVTPILQSINFYAAEDHHQDYYLKRPIRYRLYTSGSGRKGFIKSVWGDKNK